MSTVNCDDIWSYIDGTESVTFSARTVGGNTTNTASVTALKRVVRKPTDVALVGMDGVVWHLQASGMTGVVVTHGDLITDANGSKWVVQDVQKAALNTRWTCTCKKER